MSVFDRIFLFFFFNDTATTEIYTLSLHDALPISPPMFPTSPRSKRISPRRKQKCAPASCGFWERRRSAYALRRVSHGDRKSTRLNSSHLVISYAVFCLKKKKKNSLHTLAFHDSYI